MPVAAEKWKLYAGVGLVIWAAGLQVSVGPVAANLALQVSRYCRVTSTSRRCRWLEHKCLSSLLSLQYSMWELQKRPEYKEKIEQPALERNLEDELDPKQKMQWSVRTKF